MEPTPRQPNDGTAWFPPDAGPPPDADLRPDAVVLDAFVFYDSPPRPHFDARVEPAWLSASPGGGACACKVDGRSHGVPAASAFGLVILAIAVFLLADLERRGLARRGAGGPLPPEILKPGPRTRSGVSIAETLVQERKRPR